MKQSAGILLYRFENKQLLFLLVHPGGPFWAKKDEGAWTIPKGEPEEGEELLPAAQREFYEETGHQPDGKFLKLAPIKQKSGKLVHAWAVEGEMDVAMLKSNTFELEWPPRSGKMRSFPEINKAQWFTAEEASVKILPAQRALIEELQELMIG
jgi:predicted NUDIX family NTP pyrophosphohydrolase